MRWVVGCLIRCICLVTMKGGEVIAQSYPAQTWLTFRQALALGGAVRKGARGCTVFFANRFVPKGEKARAEEHGTEPLFKRPTIQRRGQFW
ncbi:MAG: DUF1738 domain-containing protein [Rhodospirillaceae bacterium]|nr:DUF1738 domain-containing protein [Rhodospirillales bacterium]